MPPFAFFFCFFVTKKSIIFSVIFSFGESVRESHMVILTSNEFYITYPGVYKMRWVFPQAQFWVLSLSLLLFRTIRLRSRLTLFLYTFLWNLRHTYSHTLNKCIIHSFFSIAIYTIEVLLVFNLLPLFCNPNEIVNEKTALGECMMLYTGRSPPKDLEK